MAEIPFETILLGLESTRGTAIDPPTHLMNMRGTVKPTRVKHRPPETRGTLVKNHRSITTRKGCEWSMEGDADVGMLPVLLNMAVKAVSSPTTPGGATNSRLWTFSRTITADDIKTATLYFGDPNVQVWQSDFCVADELVLKNDSGGDGVMTVSAKGKGGFPVTIADPTVPSSINAAMLPGGLMQLWLDTSSAIGTTEITGRLISAEHTIPTGATYKYRAAGPTSGLEFNAIGRDWTAAKTKIVFELVDTTQYANWAADDIMKCRVRHNGSLIEGSLYNYFNFDIYGQFDMFEWGTYASTNRTIEMIIESQYDATAAVDFIASVQNARTTL